MKKLYTYLLLALLGAGMAGCSDFLEESSQDEVRPSTVTDLEQLLLGEGYLRQTLLYSYLEVLTDNVQQSFTKQPDRVYLFDQGGPAYTWDKEMFERMDEAGTRGIDSWVTLYGKIKGCNVVLEMLDKVAGSEEAKGNQRGQALALRAYYYFQLVNLFAEPYNKEGIEPDKAMGVPLILSSAVKDDFPERATLRQVYGMIEKDMLEAASLLDKYGRANIRYKVTPLFAYNMLSRMYLYMGDWKKSAEYATVVLERNPQLLRLADHVEQVSDWFGNVSLTFDRENGGVLNLNSPELIWGYGDKKFIEGLYQAPEPFNYPGAAVFAVSDDLLSCYESNDLRLMAFFKSYLKAFSFPSMVTGLLCGQKNDSDNLANPYVGMRSAEAYLNRAEANIRLFLEDGDVAKKELALADLNFLREHRMSEPYTPVVMDNGEDLLEFCLQERRRELAFDNQRWFDLRRCGMPEIVHKYTVSEGVEKEYRLEKGSDRYVLPIPQRVLEKNPALRQNP